MLSSTLVSPTEADVRTPLIPAKAAGESGPFPVFQGECLCQTDQAFGQTRGEAISIHSADVLYRSAAQQRRSFPGRSLKGTGIPPEFPNEKLRQNCSREDEEA